MFLYMRMCTCVCTCVCMHVSEFEIVCECVLQILLWVRSMYSSQCVSTVQSSCGEIAISTGHLLKWIMTFSVIVCVHVFICVSE